MEAAQGGTGGTKGASVARIEQFFHLEIGAGKTPGATPVVTSELNYLRTRYAPSWFARPVRVG